MQVPLFEHGAGRRATLKKAITIQEAINQVKAHLGLPHIRVAVPQGSNLGKFTHWNVTSQNYILGSIALSKNNILGSLIDGTMTLFPAEAQ